MLVLVRNMQDSRLQRPVRHSHAEGLRPRGARDDQLCLPWVVWECVVEYPELSTRVYRTQRRQQTKSGNTQRELLAGAGVWAQGGRAHGPTCNELLLAQGMHAVGNMLCSPGHSMVGSVRHPCAEPRHTTCMSQLLPPMLHHMRQQDTHTHLL